MSHKLCSADLFCKHCFCPPAGDNPAHAGPAAWQGRFAPLYPLSDKVRTANSLSLISLSGQCPPCPLGFAKSLRSNANPSGTFCPNFVRTKRRENKSFSLTKMQASQAFSIPFFLDCATVRQQRTQHNRAFFPSSFPIKLQQPNHHRKQKTASKFSLLLLPSFCVSLHFDLLFDRPDFETRQPHEQSHWSNTVHCPTFQLLFSRPNDF